MRLIISQHIILLFVILGLALFVRIWGIDYGLPYFLIDDERTLVYTSLKMAELKTLIPTLHSEEFKIAFYAPLMSYIYLLFSLPFILIKYLLGPFSNFSELANYFALNPASLWLIARIINALMGTAAVYLIYLIGKKAVNGWVGLTAAFLLATSFYNAQFSHFTRPWGPAVFFVCLIMLSSLYIFKSPQRKYYLWTGAAGGLALGAHYAAAFGMVIFFMAHYFSGKFSFFKKTKDRNLWLAISVFALLGLVFILANLQLFLGWVGITRLSEYGTSSKSLAGYLRIFAAYFKTLLFLEPVILIPFLLGAAILWFKSKKMFFVSLSWPIIYISCLYVFFYPEFYKPITYYIILIIPWMAVLAAFAIYYLISKLRNPLKAAAVLLLLLYPFSTAVFYSYLLSQKDTRILAVEWVEENIPPETKIISNLSYANPIPTKKAILFQKSLDENSLRAADRALLNLADEDYPRPAYNILKSAYIDKEKSLSNHGYQYFLVEFWDETELLGMGQLIKEFKQGQSEEVKNINSRFLEPISTIFNLKRLGPTVQIYVLD